MQQYRVVVGGRKAVFGNGLYGAAGLDSTQMAAASAFRIVHYGAKASFAFSALQNRAKWSYVV